MALLNTYDRLRGAQTVNDTMTFLVDANEDSGADHQFEFYADNIAVGANLILRARLSSAGQSEITSTAPTSRLGTSTDRWSEVHANDLRLYGATSGTLTHQAAAVTTTHTLTWPAANAAGQLENDGAGNLSWAAGSAITGSGANDQVAVWSGVNTLDGDAGFTYVSATRRLDVGVDDTDAGLIGIRGDGAASTQGGWLALYTAADHDTTVDYYSVMAESDLLVLGRTTNNDLTVNASGIVDATVGLEVSDLTSGRVTYATTNGRLTDASTLTFAAGLLTATRFESTQTTGTAPFVVASTTAVTNLNADLLDGQHGAFYQDAANLNAGVLADARVQQSNVTQHEAALTILESQITDGTILARVGGNEVISGTWEFTAAARFNSSQFQIDNPAQTFQYVFVGSALAADRNVTLPLLTGADTFVFEAHAATLTNKTIDLANNTLTGTKAQFDTAVSDGNPAYRAATGANNRIAVWNAADTIEGDANFAYDNGTGGVTALTLTQAAAGSGTPEIAIVTGGAHTGLAENTEAIDWHFALSRTVQFISTVDGGFSTQRAVVVDPPTYAATAAETIATAATFAISGEPAPGAFMAITLPLAFWVQGGTSQFGGNLQPTTTNASSLGTSSLAWSDVFATQFTQKGTTSGTLVHAVPATVTSYTLTWPSADAAGVLTSDGAGALSWAAGGGVDTSGTPADNQIAVFVDADTIEGTADFTFTTGAIDTLQVGGSGDRSVTFFGAGTPDASVVAGQNIIQMGNGVPQDRNSGVTGVYFAAGIDGNLSNTAFVMGEGTTSSNHYVGFPNNWRWHVGAAAHGYEWGNSSATWLDRVTARGQWTWGIQNGTYTIGHQSGGSNRSFIVDCNYDTTAPLQATSMTLQGSKNASGFDSLDRWAIEVTGNSFLGSSRFEITAPGNIRLQTAGVINNFGAYSGVVIEPNGAFGGVNATGRVMHVKGAVSGNRIFSGTTGANTAYGIDLDFNIFMQGASNNASLLHMSLIEDAASGNTPLLIECETFPFSGANRTVFTVDFDGEVYALGDLAFESQSGFTGTFVHANTAARTYTLPNSSGTVLLTGDAPDISGTPAANQLALWVDADTLQGDASLTYVEGTNHTLTVGSQVVATGTNLITTGNTGNMVVAGYTPSAGNVAGGVAALQAGSPAGTGAAGDVQITASAAGTSSGLIGGLVLLTPGNGDGAGLNGFVHVNAHGLKVGGSASANHPGTGGAILTGGLVVGFDAAPVADEIRVGDADFGLRYQSATLVHVEFDNTANDNLTYNRTNNEWDFNIATALATRISAAGAVVPGGLTVGFATAPNADSIAFGDANNELQFNSGDPRWVFDANDWLQFSRGDNSLDFQVGLVSRFKVTSNEIVCNDGQAHIDFRVEGDTISHLIFADATGTTENVAFCAAAAPGWGGMDRGLFIGDTSTAPTSNPTSGGFMYVSAGALYWRGSSGNITKIASA